MSDKEQYDLTKKCQCKEDEQVAIVINFDRMWGDGDVVCDNCKKLIRTFDSG